MAGGNGFDDIFTTLASINAELMLLSERVNMLEEGRPPFGSPPDLQSVAGTPVSWSDLPPDEWTATWLRFVKWVLWLADRYEVTNDQLPRQCWWRHGAVVEELTALWTSHQSAYAPGGDPGSAPYLWQDALARAVERIGRLWIGTCRNGQHRERHRETWTGDATYLDDLLAASPPMQKENEPPCP
ncbi:hypothetical protein [Streptomyces sp. RFCAC02]|uniref:hypothetical protein n=1 Tax=Streptomyces sp. RFCAC02 TaxID=2499143 RepID=UPI0010207B66|nr:hypothetical protein [Streptomyces sp. RFCAC02]